MPDEPNQIDVPDELSEWLAEMLESEQRAEPGQSHSHLNCRKPQSQCQFQSQCQRQI